MTLEHLNVILYIEQIMHGWNLKFINLKIVPIIFKIVEKITQVIRKTKRRQLTLIIEENYFKTNSRDYYKVLGKQLQQFNPPTLMLQDKDWKTTIEPETLLTININKLENINTPTV